MTGASTSSESSYWTAALKRPVRVKNGPTLRTLRDARDFILGNPGTILRGKAWKCALALLFAAAERGGDIGAATEKIELALFMESKLLPNQPPIS